jgi:hypothetical protein
MAPLQKHPQVRISLHAVMPQSQELTKIHAGKPRDLVAFWYGQSTFQEDGVAQETCRDLGHTGYGISSISHISETSRIQGTDLYTGDVGNRLRSALEFNAKYELNGPISWLCDGKIHKRSLGPGRPWFSPPKFSLINRSSGHSGSPLEVNVS